MVGIALRSAQHGLRLDRALADLLPALSRERIKALLESGALHNVDGSPVSEAPSSRIDRDRDLVLHIPAAAPASAQPQDIPLSVVFEDAHLLVVDKPAGLVVHPAAGNLDGTLVNALLHHCAGQLSGIGGVARPGIVHRIDKDTSGLLVVAKSDAAHEGLARQFAAHSIERAYLAIASGRLLPPAGTVDAPVGRSPRDRKKMAVVAAGSGKRAVTHYATLEPLREATLLRCTLETGRTHQVRVHMAHVGHPLLGDPLYARRRKGHAQLLRSLSFTRQALHAARLGFIHPVTGATHSFESDMPPDMQELLSHLRV